VAELEGTREDGLDIDRVVGREIGDDTEISAGELQLGFEEGEIVLDAVIDVVGDRLQRLVHTVLEKFKEGVDHDLEVLGRVLERLQISTHAKSVAEDGDSTSVDENIGANGECKV
jgi:hypothetical protein